MLMMSYESAKRLHGYWYNFFVSFTAFLFVFLFSVFGYMKYTDRPVMVALDDQFEVLNPGKVVRAGDVLKYRIHYYKRLDMPGDITKQLIRVDSKDDRFSIPLADTAGHLPKGEIKMIGLARVPNLTPPGRYILRLSATYNLGWTAQHNTAQTEPFEVIP